MMQKRAVTTEMKGDVVMSDGTKITIAGTIIRGDGSQMVLGDNESVDIEAVMGK